jgi:hypothetical protein
MFMSSSVSSFCVLSCGHVLSDTYISVQSNKQVVDSDEVMANVVYDFGRPLPLQVSTNLWGWSGEGVR